MKGEDYISYAGHLVAKPAGSHTVCQYRTAISRAYYGAYHLAAAALGQMGKHIQENATGHRETIVALDKSGVSDAVDAARLIGDLQSARIKADYHLGQDRYFTEANVMLNLEDAHNLMTSIGKCLQEPARSQIIQSF
ncbi:MAG: hypothetical protein WD669_07440 [Pirellulales bacterium]